jgi:NAD(P)-dependent dehydrogenase (short-subunit alcohol dehydrogenase family)
MVHGEFSDRVVVVTGGSRGLGGEMTTAFAARGATVVIASRKLEACRELAAALEHEHGTRALPVACNVSHWDDCDQLIDTVYSTFGRADVLINNAGLSPLYDSLDQVSEALFDKVVGVNLKGPFRLAAGFGTRMAADRGGAVVNISSVAAIRPGVGELPYAAAKAGLNTLTEGLAQAFGPTVRVNGIQAGPFLTDVSRAWTDETRARFSETLALGRCGEPHEIVGAALYLASDAASFCTGATLRLDGGMR